jgi:hypothetical protein
MTGARLRLDLAVALSWWAGVVHAWTAPEHFIAGTVYGVFFVVVALGQLGYGALLLRFRQPVVLLAGIAGNVAVLTVYLLTRTVGIPVGPHAGAIEAAGIVDWLTAAAEVALVLTLCAALPGRRRAVAFNALLLLGLTAWAARLGGLL